MPARVIANQSIEFDADGFMTNPQAWTAEIGRALAAEEGIPALTERHDAVIGYLRKAFAQHGDVPTLRRLTKESGVSTKELYDLFPGGPVKKAARIAGLGKPHGCI